MPTKMTEEDWVIVREVFDTCRSRRAGKGAGRPQVFRSVALFHGPQHYFGEFEAFFERAHLVQKAANSRPSGTGSHRRQWLRSYWPTPGTVASNLLTRSLRCHLASFASICRTLACGSFNCVAMSRKIDRTSSGNARSSASIAAINCSTWRKPCGAMTTNVDVVYLKPVLGKVETDGGNIHRGRLLSVVAFTDDQFMAHRCRGDRGRPPHQEF